MSWALYLSFGICYEVDKSRMHMQMYMQMHRQMRIKINLIDWIDLSE